jgi:hypothetical protein
VYPQQLDRISREKICTANQGYFLFNSYGSFGSTLQLFNGPFSTTCVNDTPGVRGLTYSEVNTILAFSYAGLILYIIVTTMGQYFG